MIVIIRQNKQVQIFTRTEKKKMCRCFISAICLINLKTTSEFPSRSYNKPSRMKLKPAAMTFTSSYIWHGPTKTKRKREFFLAHQNQGYQVKKTINSVWPLRTHLQWSGFSCMSLHTATVSVQVTATFPMLLWQPAQKLFLIKKQLADTSTFWTQGELRWTEQACSSTAHIQQ